MAVFPSDSIRTKNWGTEILTDSDLEAQLDLLHAYFTAALNSTTGHTHDGTSNQGPLLTTLGTLTTILKEDKGADVASAAGNIVLGDDGNFFDITGTAAITSITIKPTGTMVTLQTDSTASLVDGGNLKLNGTFQGAADSTITLRSDGTNWYEVSRSPVTVGTLTGGATQADQETGTSTTVAVTSGVQHFHPGSAKFWCKFNGTTTGTNAPTAGYNVASVTRHSAGLYTVTFTTALSSANYAALVMCQNASNPATGIGAGVIDTMAAGSFKFSTYVSSDVATDSTIITVVGFGDI